MRPLETLGSVTTADGRRMKLLRRERDFFIHLDGEELMSSRSHGSESALAELACRDLASPGRPRVLIGGLGLGYTLRAALTHLPGDARVEVAEIYPEVVEWNRRQLAGLGRPLEDPRVRIRQEDVRTLLRRAVRHRYHAILLDVDNGPSAWCLESNGALYDRRGLTVIRQALVPGGALAVWSAYPDPAFVTRLRRSGFEARAETVRARGDKGPRQMIFVARVPRPPVQG